MLRGELKAEFEIVVESVGNGWADGAFCLRIQAFYCLGQDVGRRMAESLSAQIAVKACFVDVTVLVVDFHMHLPFCMIVAGPILISGFMDIYDFVKEYIVLCKSQRSVELPVRMTRTLGGDLAPSLF